jgi:glucose/arabinose dehydrogenase
MTLRRYAICVSVILSACAASCTRAQEAAPAVDERPLNVQTVPAFPKLQWPDSVTGAAEGLSKEPRPLLIMGAADGTNRLFIGTQPGTVHVIPNDPNVEQMKTFLDIRERVHYRVPQENEEGFLGLAFHPKYKENGEFFVYYTGAYTDPKKGRRSVISRFRVSKNDPNVADPDSEEILLVIPDKEWNHNGGTLVFGPDGYLYIGLGDGGAGGDPDKNGQNLAALWGKILRIDVDHKDAGLAYAIPKDNPFVGKKAANGEDARGEVWCYGIRNVWRIAFDRKTGDLWAGEVGQDTWEEIDIIVKGGNYGWNLREGFHKFKDGSDPRPDLIEPILEYNHKTTGKSITGGNVYRGKLVPELEGAYLYADFVSGHIWALWYDQAAKRLTANRTIVDNGGAVITFGEDDAGETYYGLQNGSIMRFASPEKSASR